MYVLVDFYILKVIISLKYPLLTVLYLYKALTFAEQALHPLLKARPRPSFFQSQAVS